MAWPESVTDSAAWQAAILARRRRIRSIFRRPAPCYPPPSPLAPSFMRFPWIKTLLLLAAAWLIAGGVIWWARAARPTPDSVVRYANEHSPEGRSQPAREEALRGLASRLNQLEYEQRQQVRVQRRLDSFFRQLTPEERLEFVDLTAPAGFHQMMEAFNKMDPDKRRTFVERALAQMKEREEEGTGPLPPDDPNVKKMIEHGMHAFYADASADTKMDLAPLIEQMQKNLQGF